MEKTVDSAAPCRGAQNPGLKLRLLGPLTVSRGGTIVTLPSSRKVRALLAYLALAPRPVPRSRLCELLWEVPSDPRGELRWCLSKLRRILDEPGRRRVHATFDTVALDLADCHVDAVAMASTLPDDATDRAEQIRGRVGAFEGEFLEGLAVDRSPPFSIWLAGQRRHFRDLRTSLLEQAAVLVSDTEAIAYLEEWVEVSPDDPRPHARLLDRLARSGRIKDGDEHLAAALRHFEAEDLDGAPLRVAWSTARRENAGRSTGHPIGLSIARSPHPTIAVMPFAELASEGPSSGLADGLAGDVIMGLAQLRSLSVIAAGSALSSRLRNDARPGSGPAPDIDYVVTGSVLRRAAGLRVRAELTEAHEGRVVWAQSFESPWQDSLDVLDTTCLRIVALVSQEVEAGERRRAVLRPSHALDARGAYHRALWHLYRFTRADNALAGEFFAQAIALDPAFSRAHAGLSSTHFQNAFQSWARRSVETESACTTAERGLLADDRDPAAHWAMGRALWLLDQRGSAVTELERAVELCPNFAQGYYALAFVHAQSGDPETAVACSDESRRLSPCDPMLFGILGARAMALVRLGRFEEAAAWSRSAAAQPNAHAQIQAIAAYTLALAGRRHDAQAYLARIRTLLPDYGIDDFLTAMHFAPEGEALFRDGARRLELR